MNYKKTKINFSKIRFYFVCINMSNTRLHSRYVHQQAITLRHAN